jgi:uncharacterized protein (TIGR02300 family)
MVKASWGVKRTCPCGNGVRFYDLNKKEIECPSCGESINVEHLSVSTLENNLRKKPHAKVLEKLETANEKKKDKDAVIEIDSDDDPKTDVKEIIGDKIKDKDKENE